jgi:hypothetical protein
MGWSFNDQPPTLGGSAMQSVPPTLALGSAVPV